MNVKQVKSKSGLNFSLKGSLLLFVFTGVLAGCSDTTSESSQVEGGEARQAEEIVAVDAKRLEKGKELAFDRSRGNCLSCHMVLGAEQPGNIGPPLMQMKARFPSRSDLRAQVWDSAIKNPDTIMPPYGRNKILTEEEIDMVVDYLLSI